MNKFELEEIQLIGLALKTKTFNANGQSAIDCGKLWQDFTNGNYADKIPGKLSNDILAVYHQYEGDHTKPYSYFIGCRVQSITKIPPELDSLIIPKGPYQKITATGKMPDCVANKWIEIWNADIPRAYRPDFEVYDEKIKDWNNADVDIFISVNP